MYLGRPGAVRLGCPEAALTGVSPSCVALSGEEGELWCRPSVATAGAIAGGGFYRACITVRQNKPTINCGGNQDSFPRYLSTSAFILRHFPSSVEKANHANLRLRRKLFATPVSVQLPAGGHGLFLRWWARSLSPGSRSRSQAVLKQVSAGSTKTSPSPLACKLLVNVASALWEASLGLKTRCVYLVLDHNTTKKYPAAVRGEIFTLPPIPLDVSSFRRGI